MTDTTTRAELDAHESIASLIHHLRVMSDQAADQIDADRLCRSAALLAERDAIAAQLAAAEASARESALDALAAYGQAADAHTAQLAAEARLAELEAALKKIATGTAPEADPDTGELIECWMDADEMREIAIDAIRAADPVTKSS